MGNDTWAKPWLVEKHRVLYSKALARAQCQDMVIRAHKNLTRHIAGSWRPDGTVGEMKQRIMFMLGYAERFAKDVIKPQAHFDKYPPNA